MNDVPILPGQAWLAFLYDHDEDDASARFAACFGEPPEYIAEVSGRYKMLLVGPAPGPEGEP